MMIFFVPIVFSDVCKQLVLAQTVFYLCFYLRKHPLMFTCVVCTNLSLLTAETTSLWNPPLPIPQTGPGEEQTG